MVYGYGDLQPKLRPFAESAVFTDYRRYEVRLDLRPLLAGDRLLEFDYELPLDTADIDASSFLYGVCFPSPMKVTGRITNTAGYII